MRPPLRCLLIAALLSTPPSAPAESAQELSSRLADAVTDGATVTRLRMRIDRGDGSSPEVLQIQAKARRIPTRTDLLQQVLWPASRKGEAFLLQQHAGTAPSGAQFVPPNQITQLNRPNIASNPAFGSHLALQDLIENFFLWQNQTLVGTETLGRTECLILESRPGPRDSSPYSRVRSWIDPRRLVPLRVQKFDRSGKLARLIETTNVTRDDKGRNIPSAVTVTSPGRPGSTEISGANIRRDVTLEDSHFSQQAFQQE